MEFSRFLQNFQKSNFPNPGFGEFSEPIFAEKVLIFSEPIVEITLNASTSVYKVHLRERCEIHDGSVFAQKCALAGACT